MQVSFIIPLFNCLELTKACVASLQATLPRAVTYEIILVDDGSTDGTRAWLGSLGAPFRVVLNERNLGYAAANNRGAAIAQGDVLALLNNDLVLTPGWFEPMLRAVKKLGARAGMVGNVQRNVRSGAVDHTGIFINLKGKPEHAHALPPRWLRWLKPTRRVEAVTGACVFVTAELWRQLNGFDAIFVNGGEDVDFCLRASAAGRFNVVALRSIVDHHISSSPGRKLRDEQNTLRLVEKWRPELARLAARRWCWEFLRREWTSPHPSLRHADARAALVYALHLRRTPPLVALIGMNAALDSEFARWDQLLGARSR